MYDFTEFRLLISLNSRVLEMFLKPVFVLYCLIYALIFQKSS